MLCLWHHVLTLHLFAVEVLPVDNCMFGCFLCVVLCVRSWRCGLFRGINVLWRKQLLLLLPCFPAQLLRRVTAWRRGVCALRRRATTGRARWVVLLCVGLLFGRISPTLSGSDADGAILPRSFVAKLDRIRRILLVARLRRRKGAVAEHGPIHRDVCDAALAHGTDHRRGVAGIVSRRGGPLTRRSFARPKARRAMGARMGIRRGFRQGRQCQAFRCMLGWRMK